MRERNKWLILTGLLLFLRLPGLVFGAVDIDETDFVTAGRLLGDGKLPYIGFVEKKPFLAYFFFAPSALFGQRIWPMQLAAIGLILGTAWLCALATERWTQSREAGTAAAFIAVFATAGNVGSVNMELMINLPQAWALYAYLRHTERPSLRTAAHVGFAVGIGTLLKHQAGIVLAAVGLAELWVRRARGVWFGAVMGVAFAIPWAIVSVAYTASGHGAEFFEWNVNRNFFYSAFTAGSRLAHFAEGFGVCVLGGTLLWWVLSLQGLRRPKGSEFRRAVGLVLFLTWIPVSLGGRFYEHYFIQFVPPLAILAAEGAAELWARRRDLRWRRGLYVLAFGPSVAFLLVGMGRGLAGDYPCQEKRTIALTDWLRAHAAPGDRLFVWGHYTPIYYLSELLPGTRYYNTSNHMGDFDPQHLPDGFDIGRFRSDRDIAATIEDLETRRPRWVVDTAPADIHKWSHVPLAKFPPLPDYLASHYRQVSDAGGAAIYERIPETLIDTYPK